MIYSRCYVNDDEKAIGGRGWAGDPPQRSPARERLLDTAAIEGFTSPFAIEFSRKGIRDLEAEAMEATEVILRFILSLLAAPEPRRSQRELRAFLERRLLPALGLPGA